MNNLSLTNSEIAKLKSLAEIFEYKGEIDGSVVLHVKGEFRLVCDKDIVLVSGRSDNPDRPGYKYSIWENPELDVYNRPVMMISVFNCLTDDHEVIPARFSKSGKVLLKPWQRLEKETKTRYRIRAEIAPESK